MTDRDKIAEIIRNARMFADPLSQVGYAEADALLANGMILPPCKVGDKIYFVVEYDGKYFLDEGEVGSIYKDNGGVWVSARYDSGLHYHHKESDFGKTVFLTKEEAERALKEREG